MTTPRPQSDALLDRARFDGLVQSPSERQQEPGIAGLAYVGCSLVDAFEHVVGDSEQHFLIHATMLADLLS